MTVSLKALWATARSVSFVKPLVVNDPVIVVVVCDDPVSRTGIFGPLKTLDRDFALLVGNTESDDFTSGLIKPVANF
jgi:hypothetical protein